MADGSNEPYAKMCDYSELRAGRKWICILKEHSEYLHVAAHQTPVPSPHHLVHVPMTRDLTCPECRQGKHFNCDGTTWSNEMDDLVGCNCALGGHS